MLVGAKAHPKQIACRRMRDRKRRPRQRVPVTLVFEAKTAVAHQGTIEVRQVLNMECQMVGFACNVQAAKTLVPIRAAEIVQRKMRAPNWLVGPFAFKLRAPRRNSPGSVIVDLSDYIGPLLTTQKLTQEARNSGMR